MYKAELKGNKPSYVLAEHMTKGQIGVIVDSSYEGEIVLRSFQSLVGLSTPGRWWDIARSDNQGIKVRVIPNAEVTIIGAE